MSGTSIGNATSLAAASIQATDVIPIERPGVTTPYKAKLSSITWATMGAFNILDYSAVGDGVTDDTAAIQNAINAAGDAGGGAVFVPPTAAFYNVTYAIRVPSNVTIFGVGERSHIKHTGTAAPAWWTGASWFYKTIFYVGSLGPEGETSTNPYSPFSHLTWYGIAAALAGTRQITFDTNAEADNFSVGDVVFLQSGITFTDAISGYDDPFMRPLYTQINIVSAVGDGTVDLVYPLDHDFDDASKIATEAEPYTSYDGTDTYVARNVTIRDLHLEETATDGEYAIYCGGALYCNFENIIIDHKRLAFGANALAYSQLKNITINHKGTTLVSKYPLDIACLSSHVDMEHIIMDWGGVNIAENGSFVKLEDFYIGYGNIINPGKHYVTIRDGKIARFDATLSTLSSCVGAGNTECEGDIVENVTIDGVTGTKYCISVAGNNTILRNCKVEASTTANAFGIVVNEYARGFLVEGNMVGKYGAYGTNDFIRPFGTSYLYGRIKNNISKLTIQATESIALATANDAGTPETLKTASFLGGQFRYGNMVKFTAAGWVDGTNDTKVITLHNSAVTGDPAMATISLAAGETGSWKIEAILNSGGADAASAVRCHVICFGPAAAIEQHQEYFGTADLTADWDITLVGEVANASDAIYCQHWVVEPLQDQYATA